jgi:hypothetical protein
MTVQVNSLPIPPSRQSPNNFREDSDTFFAALPPAVLELNAQNIENNALNTSVANERIAAAQQATNASVSEGNAAVSLAAAQARSTAANWVSGTTYAVGNVRRSLIDGLPYVRTTAGAGTTDPRNDPTNWLLDFLQTDTGLPAIKPTLILDPVNSGVVDPRIVTTRASTATYWDEFGVLRTAPANTLRIDHDPLTGERLGYLIEGAATNLSLHSLNPINWLGNTGATKSGGYLNINGEMTAVRIVEDTSTGPHQIGEPTNFSVIAGNQYTSTKIVRPGPRTQVQLVLSTALIWLNSINPSATFNLIDGSVIASNCPHTIERIDGNTWKISITGTCVSSGSSSGILQARNGVSTVYTGDGVSYFEVCASQFEVGTVSTSIIPTTSAAVTRAADAPVISGSAFSDFYNQNEGTFVVDIQFNGTSGFPTVFDCQGDFFLWVWATNRRIVFNGRGINSGSLSNDNAVPLGLKTRIAISYTNNSMICCNSNSPLIFTRSEARTSDANLLRIGFAGNAITTANSTFPSITYYPRAVSAAQLQALSRL